MERSSREWLVPLTGILFAVLLIVSFIIQGSPKSADKPAREVVQWYVDNKDSAQFSACVTELSDPRYVGTALTVQTCVGFLITMVSIELVPRFAGMVGWRWAFAVLAPGPALGILAMLRLRGLPEAAQIAHGRR